MTWLKTRAGSDSLTSSVAMRRSAACSRASPRAAASLRARSAVTAARIIDVSAATPRKTCVASRLSESEPRTNGPEPPEVSQTVIAPAASSAAAAPRGPKRSAAQISTGKSTYGHVALRREVRQRDQHREQRRALERLPARRGGSRRRAQVSSAGVTTSAPARSESHHVRQMRATPPGGRLAAEPDHKQAERGAERRRRRRRRGSA